LNESINPLRVAHFSKNSNTNVAREKRNIGYFSYAVLEFTWDHFVIGGSIDRKQFRDYDLIFIEEGGKPLEIINPGPPVAYLSYDSTLSEQHYQDRLKRAAVSDLILIDHDRLERFKHLGKPVRRLNYCVNEKVFKPLEKTLDVCFMCSGGGTGNLPGGKERAELRVKLGEICKELGLSYKSGVGGLDEYAAAMGHAKVVVNLPRTPTNRPHRVFDAMACSCLVITGDIPRLEEDKLTSKELTVFHSESQIEQIRSYLISLLQHIDNPLDKAINGYELIMDYHTWSIRAQQLRQILSEELGI
jgi:glycosyltransferase involved in cell wall biosynthesis